MQNNAIRGPRVFTIGHSNPAAEHFLSLLEAHGVQVVVDARSQPYSKYATQFDPEALKPVLQDREFVISISGGNSADGPREQNFTMAKGMCRMTASRPLAFFKKG